MRRNKDPRAPPRTQERGCLRCLGRNGGFAPRVPGGGLTPSAQEPRSRAAPRRACWGSPRAQKRRVRALQRAVVSVPTGKGDSPRAQRKRGRPLAPGLVGVSSTSGSGLGRAKAAASCREGGRGGERRAWDLPPPGGVEGCGLRLQLAACGALEGLGAEWLSLWGQRSGWGGGSRPSHSPRPQATTSAREAAGAPLLAPGAGRRPRLCSRGTLEAGDRGGEAGSARVPAAVPRPPASPLCSQQWARDAGSPEPSARASAAWPES